MDSNNIGSNYGGSIVNNSVSSSSNSNSISSSNSSSNSRSSSNNSSSGSNISINSSSNSSSNIETNNLIISNVYSCNNSNSSNNCNNSNSCNNSNINNCNSNKFKYIYFNIYLNSIIKNHIFYFNFYSSNRSFSSIKELQAFKFKEYLYSINLKLTKVEDVDLDALIPPNIESITIESYGYQFTSNLPSSIKKLTLKEKQSIGDQVCGFIKNSKLEYLKVGFVGFSLKDSLPASLTELDISNYNSVPLKRGCFSGISALKKLSCRYKRSSQKGAIPSSVTDLQLYCSDDLDSRDASVRIIDGFLPSGLLSLGIYNDGFTDKIKLEFTTDLPDSITSLYLESLKWDADFKLPSNLVILDIIFSSWGHSNSIVKPGFLPSKLQYLHFHGTSNFESITLPNSLKVLKFSLHPSGNSFNRQLTKQFIPSSLKELSFQNYNSPRLYISKGFNNGESPLEEGLFQCHTSLTSIDFGDHFNQVIQPSVLPSSLKILILGYKFTHQIASDSIPFNLELLKIKNENYQHPIHLSNPHTMVDSINYLKHFEKCPEKLIVLKMPMKYESKTQPPSLRHYINLQVLDLNNPYTLDQLVKEDLPTPNSIVKLVLFDSFKSVISLDDFPQLEVLIVNSSNPKIVISETLSTCTLKNIIVSSKNTQFLESIDPILHPLIKFK